MINILLVGAGFMGRVHAEAYRHIPQANLVGVVDVELERAMAICKRQSAEAYTNYEKALQELKVDAVDICLPTYMHYDFALKAADAKKHILCEKPIALNNSQASSMLSAAKRNGVRLMIGHVVRFMSEYQFLKNMLDEGQWGRPLCFTATRLSSMPDWAWRGWLAEVDYSGGTLLDLQIHDIDLANWIFGQPTEFFAQIQNSEKGLGHVFSIITYKNGKALLEASHLMPNGYPLSYSYRLLTERACIELPTTRKEKPIVYVFKYKDRDFMVKEFSQSDPYVLELNHFINCLIKDKPFLISPEEAQLALDCAIHLTESVKANSPVKWHTEVRKQCARGVWGKSLRS